MHSQTVHSTLTDNNAYNSTVTINESEELSVTTEHEPEILLKDQLMIYEELVCIAKLDYKNEIKTIIRRLYEDKERFYAFLVLVCKNVIRKRKWKKKKDQQHYYEFVTESDEAFAILLLDNNAEKYKSMNQHGDNRHSWQQPKYSRKCATGKFNGKGWSFVAMAKYFKIKNAIEEWRDNNEDRMVEIARYVYSKYRINSNNNANIEDEHYDSEIKNLCEESMIKSMTTIRPKRKRKLLD